MFLHHLRGCHQLDWENGVMECDHGKWEIGDGPGQAGFSLTCKAQWDALKNVIETHFLRRIGECILEGNYHIRTHKLS